MKFLTFLYVIFLMCSCGTIKDKHISSNIKIEKYLECIIDKNQKHYEVIIIHINKKNDDFYLKSYLIDKVYFYNKLNDSPAYIIRQNKMLIEYQDYEVLFISDNHNLVFREIINKYYAQELDISEKLNNYPIENLMKKNINDTVYETNELKTNKTLDFKCEDIYLD